MLIRFRIRFNSVCFARSSASTTKMPPGVWVPDEGEAPPRCWPSTVITTLSCGHLEMISSNLLCECISRVCLIDWFALMPTMHVGPMAFRLWIGMSDSIKRNIQLINSSLFARHRTNQTLIIERLTRRARSDFEPPVLLKRSREYLRIERRIQRVWSEREARALMVFLFVFAWRILPLFFDIPAICVVD